MSLLPVIYIPTCRPFAKQFTYQLLPAFLKEQVIFVVPAHQDGFESVRHCVTEARSGTAAFSHCKQLGEAGGVPYWQIDDDIKFVTRRLHLWGDATRAEISSGMFNKLWETRLCTEDDWHHLVSHISGLHERGFELVTFANRGTIACPWRFPHAEGLVGINWFCFSGKPNGATWDGVPEPYIDVDLAFQIIQRGYKVARLENFCISPLPPGMVGKTADQWEESRSALIARWAPFVKAKDKKRGKNDSKTALPAQITKYLVRYYRSVRSKL